MYAWVFVCAALLGGASMATSEPRPSGPTVEVAPTAQSPWRVVEEESVFAIVTRKAGFAARLAHNHLIVARDYLVRLEVDPERIDNTVFDLEALATNLVVDDPDERTRWEARIVELGFVDDLGSPDESDRAEIRETMLSSKQLDAEADPRISVALLGVEVGETVVGETTFAYVADLAVRIHGETVTRRTAADFRIEGDRIFIEAVGNFTFEEFGIEPYSAFLGSVKNKNEFILYLNLQGVR